MVIHRLKNLIGLCACEGCSSRFTGTTIELSFTSQETGRPVKAPFNLRRFRLCEDCTWELMDGLAKLKKEGELIDAKTT